MYYKKDAILTIEEKRKQDVVSRVLFQLSDKDVERFYYMLLGKEFFNDWNRIQANNKLAVE